MDNLQFAPLTACLSKVSLAAGTTTTISTTGTTTYCIRGKAYTKAAITNGATPTTDYATGLPFIPIPIPNTAPNLALGYGCIFSVGLDHSGNIKVVQGTIVPLDVSGNFINAPQLGEPPTDFCMIGYIIVPLISTAVATWTFGTNNLSGVTGVTPVFVDCCGLPDRPQVS
jgi:hypothetical protein